MLRTSPLSIGAAIALMLCASPAHAGTDEYLAVLGPRYAYLSSQRLLDAGAKVCAATRSGEPATEIVNRLSTEVGISVPAAYDIVTNAVVHLGC